MMLEKSKIIELKKNYLLVAFLLLPMAALFAQMSVATNVSNKAMLIGDQTTFSIVTTYSEGISIDQVDYSVLDGIEHMEVYNTERLDKEGENSTKQTILELKLIFWEQGEYQIPPIPITYQAGGKSHTTQSEAATITVSTLNVEQDSTQLMPIKDIIEERMNFYDFLPIFIGLVGLGILAFVFIYVPMRKKRTAGPPKPIGTLPLYELSEKELAKLEKKELWQSGAIKEYHSQLTYVLRTYLERRYQIKALESTSDQVIHQLEGIDHIDRNGLSQLLQTADLIKFAKAEPAASFHQEALGAIRRFIQDTRDDSLIAEIYKDGRIIIVKKEEDQKEE